MQPTLSFDQAPPISIPYRFFLSAPWLGVAAGLVLVWFGERALISRWSPETLAATHLLTTGFVSQAMCGALFQFVPVAAGGNVPKARFVGALTHPILIAGSALLAAGFLTQSSGVLLAAIPVFGLGGGVFVVAIGLALVRVSSASATLLALRLAVAGLAATLALGGVLAYVLAGQLTLPVIELTFAHVAIGLGGWGLVLVAGVSLFVVPMFQLTPPYPPRFAKPIIWLVFVAATIGVLSGFAVSLSDIAQPVVGVTMLLAAATYAGATLWIQSRRKRKVTDATFWYFRGGVILIFGAVLSGILTAVVPADDERTVLSFGTAALSAFVALISGMLYKIIPFINWLHLQRLTQQAEFAGTTPPNTKSMIPDVQMWRQMQIQLAASMALVAAVWLPALVRPAGLLWVVSMTWLAVNLSRGVRRYCEFRDQIRAGGVRRGS